MSCGESSVVIVGGGTMGGDIALLFALGGWNIYIVEPVLEQRKTLPTRIRHKLQELCAEDVLDRFMLKQSLEDVPWDGIDIVVECVIEDLPVKQKLFNKLVTYSPANIPLTSNSSGFPISWIGEGLVTQQRMLGLHFFMPAHIIPLVEIVSSAETDPSITQHVTEIMKLLGKRPVHVKRDIPGFLANRLQHALIREAISLVEKGIATPEDIDTAVQYGFGFRYAAAGPLLQKDLSGLDILCTVATSIYPDLCNDKVPSAYLTDKVASGHTGMKSMKGFYDWDRKRISSESARYEETLKEVLDILK